MILGTDFFCMVMLIVLAFFVLSEMYYRQLVLYNFFPFNNILIELAYGFYFCYITKIVILRKRKMV